MEFLRLVTVEPTLFLQSLGDTLTLVIYQNLIIGKICKTDLGWNSSVNCDLNPNDSKLHKDEIQSDSSNFLLLNSLVANSFPILINLIFGVLSDRHCRRKPAMILSLFGKVFRSLGLFLNAHFFQWHPFLLLLTATLPEALGGGSTLLHTTIYAYIADSSELKSRTWRMGLAEGATLVGTPLGLYMGMFLFKLYGDGNYLLVFGASFFVHFVNLLYTFFWVPEISNHKIIDLDKMGDIIREDGDDLKPADSIVDYIFGTFKTILTPRPHHKRKCLMAVLSTLCFLAITFHGESAVRYLFTRTKFGWDEKQFSEWTIAETISLSFGIVILMPLLTRVLKWSDPLIGVLATASRIIFVLCCALASQSRYLYYGAIVNLPSALAVLCGKSLLSKIIPSHERGRAFAFLGFMETIVPLMAVPLYSFIFTRTLTFDPSFIFYVSTSFYTLIFFIFGALFLTLRMRLVQFNGGDQAEGHGV